MKLRIGSGKFKGRVIKSPNSKLTRVTTGYSRKVIFDTLQSNCPEASILDLFAGSGSLGLEALSRGAIKALFVDAAALAINTIKENIAALDLHSSCRTIKADALKYLAQNQTSQFDIIFADPPYSLPLETLLQILTLASGILSPSGIICLETPTKNLAPLKLFELLTISKAKTKGNTTLLFFRLRQPKGQTPLETQD